MYQIFCFLGDNCSSNTCCKGINLFPPAWNLHRIQGRGGGIPLVLASTRNFTFSLSHIPTVQEAVNMYLGEGGNLTPESGIGRDPLQNYPQLQVLRA